MAYVSYVTPHHQMRHKSEIQKLRLWDNVIEENIGFKMLKEWCFYNMRKMGLKIALFTILILIYIYSQ